MNKPRLLFLVNEDWFFWSHRLHLAKAAQQAGFDVLLVTRVSSLAEKIRAEGIELFPIDFPRGIRNPLKELSTLRQLIRIYRETKPDLVHHVTVKNVLLGTIAARWTRVPAVVNAFAGLGYVFIAQGIKARLFRGMLRQVLRTTLKVPNMKVILQNEDDHAELERSGIVQAHQAVLIRGAGVDVKQFHPQSVADDPPIVVLASRLLWSKGVGEFVESARCFQTEGSPARFVVVGRVDPGNPDHIPQDQMHDWCDEGAIEWWGNRDDMPDILARAAVVCLPTFYGEGLPKVLLEAAACGTAIVATDIRGCREICKDNVNGILIPIKNVDALTEALKKLLADEQYRNRLGAEGRKLVIREFTSEKIGRETLEVYLSLVDPAAVPSSREKRAA